MITVTFQYDGNSYRVDHDFYDPHDVYLRISRASQHQGDLYCIAEIIAGVVDGVLEDSSQSHPPLSEVLVYLHSELSRSLTMYKGIQDVVPAHYVQKLSKMRKQRPTQDQILEQILNFTRQYRIHFQNVQIESSIEQINDVSFSNPEFPQPL